MTVKELIEALEKIENKDLIVVADLGLDFCDRPYEQPVEEVFETEKYFNLNGYAKTRKCVKII